MAKEQQATTEERKTPEAWGKEAGVTSAHIFADQFFGWSFHSYNFQAPGDALLLTREQYNQALEVVVAYPCTTIPEDIVAPSYRERLAKHKAAPKSLKDGE